MDNTTKPLVALMGAGGKMGCRLADNLRDHPGFAMRYLEVGEAGLARMREKGLSPTPAAEILPEADIILLAVPDAKIGAIAAEVVPKVKSGAILMGLDPAAGYAEILPEREDITYFIAHPCHPPLFHEVYTEEAQTDWFGGYHAPQGVVCALLQGPEEHYAVGEALAAAMYAPVSRTHRLTVEQMALLEPGLVETTCATLITAMREALDEVVKMGVPKEAAWDFTMGHIRIELAILFDKAGFPFSDGAKLAVRNAQKRIFRDDWKEQTLSLASVRQQVKEIVEADSAK